MTNVLAHALGFALLCCSALPAGAQDLDQHLSFFAPLLDKTWVGGYVDHDLEITLRLESTLQGKVLRYRRAAEEVGFHAETHCYWDPRREEVAYLALNTRGIVERGSAREEDGRIILRGKSQWADRDVDVRWIMEILPDGRLRDTYERLENGVWVPGHVQEFAAQ